MVLSRDDCLRLLGLGGVGRIAVPGDRVPTMRPVNFALQGERIVMRTSDRALWAAAEAGVGASFEFDEVRNEDHWTWNVIATGSLEELVVDAPVTLWAPSADERSLALTINDVSGARCLTSVRLRCRAVRSRQPTSPASEGGSTPNVTGSIGGVVRSGRGGCCGHCRIPCTGTGSGSASSIWIGSHDRVGRCWSRITLAWSQSTPPW